MKNHQTPKTYRVIARSEAVPGERRSNPNSAREHVTADSCHNATLGLPRSRVRSLAMTGFLVFGVWLLMFGFSSSAYAQNEATISPFTSRASITQTKEHPPLPLDKDIISQVYWYELLPATENRLAVPVFITMTYPNAEERWKEIFIYNQELGTWQNLPGSINREERRVIAPTTWASGWLAVFADRLEKSEYLKEKINSPAILLVDAKTGEILVERASGEERPIASLTKLATAAVFLDNNPGWKASVALRPEDDTIPAKIYARAGDVFTTHDLFYATLVKSANNAAKALARSTGLSGGEFVAAMNEKAKTLGMEHTRFVEPTGLSANNVSTAQDYLKLSSAVFADPLFLAATTPKVYTIAAQNGTRHTLLNSNKLLDVPYVVIGSKTGFTNEAGRCLVMKVRNTEGREIIAVTMGADTPGAQWEDMRMLLDAALGK